MMGRGQPLVMQIKTTAFMMRSHTSESTEMFEAEFDDSVSTVMNFNKYLKFVLMTVHTMF
jgi:hypothetical protein